MNKLNNGNREFNERLFKQILLGKIFEIFIISLVLLLFVYSVFYFFLKENTFSEYKFK